jgi:hypothetical protein
MNVAMHILTEKALKNRVKRPDSKNPYKKTVTLRENGKIKTKTEDRPLPDGLSENDKKILKHVRRKAYKWDQQFRCCCFGVRFGWSSVLGLIPL